MDRYRCIAVTAVFLALSADAVMAQDSSYVAVEPASPSSAAASTRAGQTGAAGPDSAKAPVRLSLDDALALALEESEEVRAASARVDGARAQVKGARSAALPKVDAQLGYTRTVRSVYQDAGFGLPDSLSFSPDPSAPLEERVRYLEQNAPLAGLGGMGSLFGNLPFGQENTWAGGITVTQPLFAGGRIRSGMSAAGAAEGAARAELEESKSAIALEVKEAYYAAVLADQSVTIVDGSVGLAQEHLDQVQLQNEAGRASDLDVMRAEVERENLDPQLVQARNARDLALLNLKRLINLPMDDEVDLSTALDPGPAGTERIAAIALPELGQAADQLERRAAMRAAQEQVAVQREQVDIARSGYWPSVSLMGTMSRQAFPSGVFPSSNDWRDDWNVGVMLQWTPFDGLKREADIDAAHARVREAELELDQLAENVRLEYEQALGELKRAQTQVGAAASNASQAERVYELTEMRYGDGLATQLEVSDARLALQQARLNQLQAFHDAYLAAAKAERALGVPVEQTVRPTAR